MRYYEIYKYGFWRSKDWVTANMHWWQSLDLDSCNWDFGFKDFQNKVFQPRHIESFGSRHITFGAKQFLLDRLLTGFFVLNWCLENRSKQWKSTTCVTSALNNFDIFLFSARGLRLLPSQLQKSDHVVSPESDLTGNHHPHIRCSLTWND